MLPKAHRLRRSQDIEWVLKVGRRQKRGPVSIYRAPSPAAHSRYTCIVGKKVSPRATQRHRFQRWLREVGRDMLRQQTSPTDIVVVAHPAIQEIKSLPVLKQSILG